MPRRLFVENLHFFLSMNDVAKQKTANKKMDPRMNDVAKQKNSEKK